MDHRLRQFKCKTPTCEYLEYRVSMNGTGKKNAGDRMMLQARGTPGRKRLNISSNSICDSLKKHKNVKAAAESLGCSKGYIYKIVGAEKVRELLN